MMGKPSQTKGRRGELGAAKEAEEFGLTARVHGQYEALDISIEGDPYEVKTLKRYHQKAYDALDAKARGIIGKSDRSERLITLSFRDWLEDQRELKELRAKCKNPVGLTEEGRRLIELLLKERDAA